MKKLPILLLILLLCLCVAAAAVFLFLPQGEPSPESLLSPKDPQLLTLWHYYNGTHQQAFDRLVLTFNETVGSEKGIIIEAKSQGGVGDLNRKLLASAKGEFGAEPMPDIFAAYADMAWDVSKLRELADLTPYFTSAELAAYIPSYVEEGRLAGSEALTVFPVAKSTEVLMLDRTEWYLFSSATGADASLLSTWEGIRDVSRMYYEWTDGLTPDTPDDGRAFFGLDSCANFLIIASQQLGAEMFGVRDGKAAVTIDEAVMRRIWDVFVVPSVSGWYGAYGAYRTDDVKTGRLAALVGSTSGAVYFPRTVTRQDGTSYAITGECLPTPIFQGAVPYAVQQGAGMAVTAGDPVREYAASVFLKWFTQEANNIDFSIASGYLPVRISANDAARLDSAMEDVGISDMLRDSLLTSAEMARTYTLYTTPVFDGCYAVREAAEKALPRAIAAACEERDRLISAGMDRASAIAKATGDEAFAAWLDQFRTAIADILK